MTYEEVVGLKLLVMPHSRRLMDLKGQVLE